MLSISNSILPMGVMLNLRNSLHLISQRLRDTFRFMRGNMLVLSLTNLLGNFSRAMVFPYTSLYILALGGQAEQIGFITALSPLIGLVLFPIAGYITDNAGRVRIIALSYYLSGIFLLLFVFAPSWEWIALAMFLRGSMALQFPARSAIIADSLSPEERGTGIATMNTIGGTLSIIAPFIAGQVVDHYGPNWGVRVLYAAMLLLYVGSGVITQRYLKETAVNADRNIEFGALRKAFVDAYGGLGQLMRSVPPVVLALTAVIILCFMTNGIISAFWVVYAVEEVGLSPVDWGLILLLETLVRNLLFIPGGILVDRLGRTVALGIALVLALIAMPLFVLVHGFIGVLLVRILVILAQVLLIPASIALMADSIPRAIRGRVMAATGQGGVMLGNAGGGTGGPGTGYLITIPLMISSVAGGFLYGANPAFPWYVAGGMMALALVVTIFFVRDAVQAEA